MKIIEEVGGIGFFHYGPRFRMFGEVEPLKALQDPVTRPQIIQRVLKEYPERTLASEALFYRVRMNRQRPTEPDEYDSPPLLCCGEG